MLNAARLAADVEGVPTVLLARTDADSAQLHHLRHRSARPSTFSPASGRRKASSASSRGRRATTPSRAASPSPNTPISSGGKPREPNLADAKRFADAIRHHFPGKLLAYNCSPSFNWRRKLAQHEIADFQAAIGAMGYKYQFVTLAGFHSSISACSSWRAATASAAWRPIPSCRRRNSRRRPIGYTAIRHQREVGTGYFDAVAVALSGGTASTTAMAGSTEIGQFYDGLHPEEAVAAQ